MIPRQDLSAIMQAHGMGYPYVWLVGTGQATQTFAYGIERDAIVSMAGRIRCTDTQRVYAVARDMSWKRILPP